MSSQRSFMPKKRKGYWGVSEIGPSPPPPLKVDADAAADDDGRIGIWKTPLPGGTADLRNERNWRRIFVWGVFMLGGGGGGGGGGGVTHSFWSISCFHAFLDPRRKQSGGKKNKTTLITHIKAILRNASIRTKYKLTFIMDK